jgi:hypothetical protein
MRKKRPKNEQKRAKNYRKTRKKLDFMSAYQLYFFELTT